MNKKMAHFLLLPLLISIVQAEDKVRYDGYCVYRVIPRNLSDRETLKIMENQDGYYFWNGDADSNQVDLMVAPEKIPEFQNNTKQMDTQLMMSDVQKYIDADQDHNINSKNKSLDWKTYHNLDTINSWMDSLIEKYPRIIEPLIGGRSYEGRNIRGIKLSTKKNNPIIFLEGGIHPIEWITPAVMTYIVDNLVNGNDSRVKLAVDNFDFYIFPVVNPDGYEYSHKVILDYSLFGNEPRIKVLYSCLQDRLWTKTRRQFSDKCFGVDLSRNWNNARQDERLTDRKSDLNPCSRNYPGESAFSEIEAQTLSRFLRSIQKKLIGYIAFHSYGQLLLLPQGPSQSVRSKYYRNLVRIGNVSVDALRQRHNTNYEIRNDANATNLVFGSPVNWARRTLRVPLAFTYQLRDQGTHGFLLPADQILPTAEETFDSLMAMCQETRRLGYRKSRKIIRS